MKRLSHVVVVLLLSLPAGLSAQYASVLRTTLAQADAFYSAGDVERARSAYEKVLAQDPDNTRAMFQLARLLEDDAPRAVSLLRGYVAAEPSDPWGHWALGEALTRAGDLEGASDALSTALRQAPDEREFVVALAGVLARDGRHGDAADAYGRWVESHPRDADALREQGEQLRRARRLHAAATAYEASLRLQGNEAAEQRLDAIRAELAPSLEPSIRVSRDSDGNTTVLARVDAGVPVREGMRIGFSGTQLRGDDALRTSTSWHGLVGLDWTASRGAALEAYAGAAGLANKETAPLLRLRARWRPTRGPAAEVRFQHAPVTSTPHLLANPVLLSEARASVDLPLGGALVVRGSARRGRLVAGSDANTRSGYGGGIFLRGGTTELGGHYRRTRYAESANVGYFAPREVESVELGGYTEIYGAWPLTIVFDAGVGGERITDWEVQQPGRPRGTQASQAWKPAGRLWSMVSWSLRPGRELRLELEGYESHASPALAPTSARWRWGSVGLSFRTAVR